MSDDLHYKSEVHDTVLLREAVNALSLRADGIYVDGTFGRGGHSALILDQLGEQGQLIGIDKDVTAVEVARQRFGDDPRFAMEHASFAQLPEVLERRGLTRKVDGLLLDLGVSSPQLDDAERGFSFMRDGPLDMRMDQSRGMSAADWVNTAEADEMAAVFREYGEERFAGRIAHAIVRERVDNPLQTTLQLARLIEKASPKKEKHKHPATRVFQAIRIFINRELDDLETLLQASLQMLAVNARLVVISFHSLEDRIVKHFMREQSRGPQLPKGLPVMHQETTGPLRLVGKAIKPGQQEIDVNPRARSAVMRVAEVQV